MERKLIRGKRRILLLKALILTPVHSPLIRDGPDVGPPDTWEHLCGLADKVFPLSRSRGTKTDLDVSPGSSVRL